MLAWASRTPLVMMPEGPEVRALVDRMQPTVGKKLTRVEFLSGRYKDNPPVGYPLLSSLSTNTSAGSSPSSAVGTTTISSWNCKGKFIYIQLDDDSTFINIANDNINSPTTSSLSSEDDGKALKEDDFQRSVWITLGMTGTFRIESPQQSRTLTNQYATSRVKEARWSLELQDGHDPTQVSRIYYHDTRNFGTLKFCTSRQELMKKLKSLGPDILSPNTTVTDWIRVVQTTRTRRPGTNICKFIMDQSKVCGVGNYILAEGLHKARIDPFASLAELNSSHVEKLFQSLQSTAQWSYASQTPTATARSTTSPSGKYPLLIIDTKEEEEKKEEVNARAESTRKMSELESGLYCYGRKICANGDPVIRDVNGPHGRTIWYTEAQLFMPRSERVTIESNLSTNGTTGHQKSAGRKTTMNDTIVMTNRGMNRPAHYSTNSAPVEGANPLSTIDIMLQNLHEPSWKDALRDIASSDALHHLADNLAQERRVHTVYPPPHLVFTALNLVPIDRVRVIILGQDPYHGPHQAHGLAFSVPPGVLPPPSLRNILKEVANDVGGGDGSSRRPGASYGCLTNWARQGVLLLNTVFTVRANEAHSHSNFGWSHVTEAILEAALAYHAQPGRRGVVLLLWGRPAQATALRLPMMTIAPNSSPHEIIQTSHPSPLGATKTSSPFLGSRCFSRANAALKERGYEPIDWTL